MALRYLVTVAVLAFATGLRAQEPDVAEDVEPAVDEVAILRAARDALVAAADFVGARAPATQVVAALEAAPEGPTVSDVLHLARIHAELREFEDAQTLYLRAIAMLEAAGGEYSTTLIGPYQALGRSYINERRFGEAIAALEQAQHISQRNAGLFNVEQSEIIDDITMAHLGVGNTTEARSLQLQRLDNAIRRFGEGDLRVIPFHSHLGDYYDRSRLRVSAREQYAKILSIQEAEFGVDDPRLLATLRKLVRSDLLLGRSDEANGRLASMLELNPDADPVERALSLAVLGDWATVQEDPMLARQYYRDAYLAMEAADAAAAAEVFGQPEMIDFIPPLSAVDRGTRSRRPYTWASIVLEFDVSADGRASNVRAVAANPAGAVDDIYSRRIRETHFRPKLVAGEAAAVEAVRLTHYFRAYVSREEAQASEDEEG